MTRAFTRAMSLVLLSAAPMLLPAARAVAQEVAVADRGPRFLVPGRTRGAEPVEVDVSRVSTLRRKISLDLQNVPLGQALDDIASQAGIRFVYVQSVLPVDSLVRFHSDSITVAAALTELLLGLQVDALLGGGSNQIALVQSTNLRMAPGTIVGRVNDGATGQPIALAELRVIGTQIGATADDSGQYVLRDVPAGEQRVTARRIGYQAQTQTVRVPDGGTATLDFALAVAATRLDELVTTATGAQERVRLGNAISRIEVESLAVSAPIRSLNDVLTARAPGVQVFDPGGLSGLNGRIRVRGLNSFSVSNDPLVIVDGARVENSVAYQVFPNPSSRTGRLADLNPEEIESIDIVKGPSAATLYGTDAANGVILITTRRGRAGRPRYSFHTEQGVIRPDASRYPANWYAFGRSTATGDAQQCRILQMAAGSCVQDSVSSWNSLLQSPSSPLGTGYRGVYGAQMSGAVSGLTYFVSGEYEKELGYLRMPEGEQQVLASLRGSPPLPEQIRPNMVEKVSLRGNAGVPLGQRAELALSTGLVLNDTRLPNVDALLAAVNGRGVRGTDDAGIAAEWNGQRPASTLAQVNDERVTRFIGSLTSTYRPFGWLTTRGTVGLDFSNTNATSLSRRGEQVAFNQTGSRLDNMLNLSLYSADLSGVASVSLSPAVSSRTAVGGQYNRRRAHSSAISATGLVPGAETVVGAQTIVGGESTIETIVAGAFVEQTLGWREQLFVTGALRLDGASSFGANFATAVYPKASLSWLALDGSARRAPLGLSTLRLRAAYGSSGVQPGPTVALATNAPLTGLVNGAQVNATTIQALGNPDLKPERQTEVEAGVDAEWFSGRVRLEATFYNRESRDALINLPWAPELGLTTEFGTTTTQQFNVGKVRNRGFEGLVSARLVNQRALTVDLALNGSLNTNTLLTLGERVPFVAGFGTRQIPGYPLHGFWNFPISYSDANGNGILEPSEVVVGDAVAYLGNTQPKHQLGVSLTVGLINDQLRLTALGDYRGGYRRFNVAESVRCRFFGNCRAINDSQTPLGEQAAAVAYVTRGTTAGYFYDGSFARLRELGLTYLLPTRVAQRMGARTLAVSLTARNLFLITDYPGVDPEGTYNPLSDLNYEERPQLQTRYFLLRVSAGL